MEGTISKLYKMLNLNVDFNVEYSDPFDDI